MGEHKLPQTSRALRHLAPPRTINVQCGHNGQEVVIKFNARIDHVTFTLENARQHIATLTQSTSPR